MSKEKAHAVVVFTFKSIEHLLRKGGTSSWRLDRSHARQCEYAVCTRNSHHKSVEGTEDHHSAFLLGRISDIVTSPRDPDRYLIKFSEYARVSIPGVWKGDRNPVRYASMEELGIDPKALKWMPMPEPTRNPALTETSSGKANAPLTIAEAKRGLALTLGVQPEAIEITIRG